jgi:FlaA1/EpsC-like NDP-sugar epimerase
LGIYLFAAMLWASAVGYTLFPLSESGFGGRSFQDFMHIGMTVLVVSLSIASLLLILIGGFHSKQYRSLAVWATLALLLMLAGAIGVNVVPTRYFGIPERFSVLAAMGFNAVLGVYLFLGFFEN